MSSIKFLTSCSAAVASSGQLGDDRAQWLLRSLEYRDRKAAGYRLGIWLLLASLAFYVIAIAIMLMHPVAT